MTYSNHGKNPLGKLFLSMLYISAFTFGGGFVIITFMKRKFVDELHKKSFEYNKHTFLLYACLLNLIT